MLKCEHTLLTKFIMATSHANFLNGWRRLWIVFSVALLVAGVGVFSLINSNPEKAYQRELTGWQKQVEQLKSNPPKQPAGCDKTSMDSQDKAAQQFYAEYFCQTTDQQMKDLNQKIDQVKQRISENKSEQAARIRYGTIFYTAIVVGVYLLGESIAWIRRGFKAKG